MEDIKRIKKEINMEYMKRIKREFQFRIFYRNPDNHQGRGFVVINDG